jgi:hypothetical protein
VGAVRAWEERQRQEVKEEQVQGLGERPHGEEEVVVVG